ncbi:hypothetical protein TNCV_408391 [Trichonephila clavipes]|nr:hypothetical protein TNCV_408391 [Trichonephila clavipes]
MRRQVITIEIVQNCSRTVDTDGLKVVRRVQTNSVCWRCQLNRRQPMRLCNLPSLIRKRLQVALGEEIHWMAFRVVWRPSNLRPIPLTRYVAGRWLRTAIEKCAGSPLHMNHTFWWAVSITSCRKSTRSRKFTCV